MTRKTPLKPEEVKAAFKEAGITITAWAEEHDYPRKAVYRLLNGVDKGNFGQAHEIAVKLGLKLPRSEPSTLSGAGNTQERQAA